MFFGKIDAKKVLVQKLPSSVLFQVHVVGVGVDPTTPDLSGAATLEGGLALNASGTGANPSRSARSRSPAVTVREISALGAKRSLNVTKHVPGE